MSLIQALMWNVGTYLFNAKERRVAFRGDSASTNVDGRGGATRSTDEASVMGVERRGCVIQSTLADNL